MRNKVLELLRQAGEGFISGEEMAKRLGVSRTAVWKHIRELRSQGYGIESQASSGYTLTNIPDRLLEAELQQGLGTKRIGCRIICHDILDSTNREAKSLAGKSAAEGTVVVAEEQTGGRGRLERPFFSPPGKGIWLSIILRPPFLPQEAPKCTLLAAVAVAEAMQEFGLQAGIKWPNDILYEGKKLVGILTEMSAEMDGIKYIVVGIGINVNISRDEFPEELREIATSLSIMKREEIPRVAFLQAVLRAFDRLYAEVLASGFAPVFAAWRRYAVTLGKEVRVLGVRTGENFEGRAVDIDEDGALLVETESGIRRVLAGDVSIR